MGLDGITGSEVCKTVHSSMCLKSHCIEIWSNICQ
jgi:hypothetical protein